MNSYQVWKYMDNIEWNLNAINLASVETMKFSRLANQFLYTVEPHLSGHMFKNQLSYIYRKCLIYPDIQLSGQSG